MGVLTVGSMSTDNSSNQSDTTQSDAASTGDGNHEQETLGGPRPDSSNTASKDPSEWVTGDEPMTGPQRSYLDTLAREAGQELPADLTKAEASQHIDELQQVTGRGADS